MKTLKVDIKNDIATVVLNRPEVRNAFNEVMIEEITTLFQDLEKKKELRVIILKGEGESFCAGGDLHWMKSMAQYTEKENKTDSIKLFEMYEAISNVSIPIINLVQGHAMGGGLGLMAVSDIVISHAQTQFCFSEVKIGLAPSVISHFVAKKIRPADMHRYFLTAEIFDGKAAIEMGLVHFQGEQSAMDDFLNKIVKKIKNNGPIAVRESKKLIQKLKKAQDPKKITTDLIAKLRVSPEGQEGLTAFFEKRKPSWMEQ